MNPIEKLLVLLREAARLEARIVSVQESSDLTKTAGNKLFATEYSARSIMDDVVQALAAQQLADHVAADLETLPKVTS